MKNLFIVLLIAAIGAGVYLYFSKRQNDHVNSKELIVGKWKIKSAASITDSSQVFHQYEFLKNGNVLRFSEDSAKIDTLQYQWKDDDHIAWTEKGNDSATQNLSIVKLSQDSLIMRSNDSVDLILGRAR